MKRTLMAAALLLAVALLATGCQKAESGGDPAGTPNPSYQNPATIDGDVQTVTTKFSYRGYAPITVQAGIPVVWTIQVDAGNLNGCNDAIQIPAYKIVQGLSVGESVVEFTPTETGTIPYSCWMGMIRSRIVVVDDLAADAAGTV